MEKDKGKEREGGCDQTELEHSAESDYVDREIVSRLAKRDDKTRKASQCDRQFRNERKLVRNYQRLVPPPNGSTIGRVG